MIRARLIRYYIVLLHAPLVHDPTPGSPDGHRQLAAIPACRHTVTGDDWKRPIGKRKDKLCQTVFFSPSEALLPRLDRSSNLLNSSYFRDRRRWLLGSSSLYLDCDLMFLSLIES